jgi:hypothetical protein
MATKIIVVSIALSVEKGGLLLEVGIYGKDESIMDCIASNPNSVGQGKSI